jgi:hypothetical protein
MLGVMFRKVSWLLFAPLMFGPSVKTFVPLKRHCFKETAGAPQASAIRVVEAVSIAIRLAGCAVTFAGKSGVPETMEMAFMKPRISTVVVPSLAM